MSVVLVLLGGWLLAAVVLALVVPRLLAAPRGRRRGALSAPLRVALGVLAAVGVALAAVGVSREAGPGGGKPPAAPSQDAYGAAAVRTLGDTLP